MSKFKKITTGLFLGLVLCLFILVAAFTADIAGSSASCHNLIVADSYSENGSSTVDNSDQKRGKSHISKPLAESGTSTAGNPPKHDTGTTMPRKGSVV